MPALLKPRFSGIEGGNPNGLEPDVHSSRLLPLLALLALLPQSAIADDDWFLQQFKSVSPPARAPAAARPALPPAARPSPAANATAASFVPVPRPAPRPWRTLVVPVPIAPPPAPVRTASLPQARQEFAAPAFKPLTGYAHELSGLASYYWQEQTTSSGERFDRKGLTAAHRTLPLGTMVRVTNLSNGMTTVVRINDRGPFKPGRVIDLSEAAALLIHMTGPGIARVALDVVR